MVREDEPDPLGESLLDVLLDHLRLGVVAVDRRGRVTRCNPAARRLLRAEATLDGAHVATVLAAPEGAERSRLLAGLLGGESRHGDLLIGRKGSDALLRWRTTPVRDAHQQVCGTLATFVDATEEHEAERSLALLDALVRSVPLGHMVFDGDGRYLRVNDAMLVMNGGTRAERIGHLLEEVQPALAAQALPIIRRVLATGEAVTDRRMVGELPGRPGDQRVWRLSYYPVGPPGGDPFAVGIICEDVTEAERSAAQVVAVQRVTSALLGAVTPGQVASVALGLAAPQVGAASAGMALVGAGGSARITPLRSWSPGEAAVWSELPAGSDHPVSEVLSSGGARWMRDGREWAGRAGGRERSWAFLPLATEAGTIGALMLGYSTAQSFPPAQRDALSSIADQCAMALGRARYQQEAAESRERLSVLAQAGEALAGSLEWGDALEAVVGVAVPALADWCCLHLVREGELGLVALRHGDPAREERLLHLLGGLTLSLSDAWGPGAVAASGRAQVLAEVTEEMLAAVSRTPEALATYREIGFGGGVVVPLSDAGGVFGSLCLCRDGQLPYDGQELRLAEDLGRRAALALGAARELAQRRAMAERTLRLQQATASLARATTEDQVARIVLHEAREGVGATGGGLGLIDPARRVQRFRWTFGWDRATAAADMLPERPLDAPSLSRVAMDSGEPVFVDSAAELTRLLPPDRARVVGQVAGRRSWAVLPLVGAGGPLGSISLSFPTVHRFPPEERAFLGSLGAQASNAIERVRRHQVEHRVAEALQRALLEGSLPDVAGMEFAARYLPASDEVRVGGDWYDAFRLPGGRVGLVIGDVVGHDLAAAGTMGRLRAELRACAHAAGGPGQALAQLDDLVHQLSEGDLATIAYALCLPGSAVLELAVAGHPPPLLLDREGARFVDGAPGPPVGAAVAAAGFETRRIAFAGERPTLVLYTDGLVERRGAPIEVGMEALRSLAGSQADLEPDRLADALLRGLLTGPEREDDVALLVCRLPAGA